MKNFLFGFADGVSQFVYTVMLIVCVIAIVGVILFSLFKLRKVNATLAVIVSGLGSVLLSIPMVASFNHIVQTQALKDVSAQVKARRLELENQDLEYKNRQLEIEKMNKQLKIAGLQEEIDLLKNAQMSMQSFGKICEVALLSAQLNQTEVKKEQLGEASQSAVDGMLAKTGITAKTGLGGKDSYTDEVLVITTHDINAKFGIDLNDVKVKRTGSNTLNVSGLHSKYIGSDKNISNRIVSEIRRNKFTNGTKVESTISNSKEDIQKASEFAKKYETKFQERLSQGLELGFMDDSVVKLGENFITVILSSLGMELTFNNDDTEGSVPIMEYFENELSEKEGLLNEVE